MAKANKEKEKPAKRKAKKIEILPLEAVNYKILVAGVVVSCIRLCRAWDAAVGWIYGINRRADTASYRILCRHPGWNYLSQEESGKCHFYDRATA